MIIYSWCHPWLFLSRSWIWTCTVMVLARHCVPVSTVISVTPVLRYQNVTRTCTSAPRRNTQAHHWILMEVDYIGWPWRAGSVCDSSRNLLFCEILIALSIQPPQSVLLTAIGYEADWPSEAKLRCSSEMSVRSGPEQGWSILRFWCDMSLDNSIRRYVGYKWLSITDSRSSQSLLSCLPKPSRMDPVTSSALSASMSPNVSAPLDTYLLCLYSDGTHLRRSGQLGCRGMWKTSLPMKFSHVPL